MIKKVTFLNPILHCTPLLYPYSLIHCKFYEKTSSLNKIYLNVVPEYKVAAAISCSQLLFVSTAHLTKVDTSLHNE